MAVQTKRNAVIDEELKKLRIQIIVLTRSADEIVVPSRR